MMKLESLRLYNYHPASEPEGYRAEVAFAGPRGKVEIKLDPRLSAKVLAICLDEIAKATRDAADQCVDTMNRAIAEMSDPEPVLIEE